MEYDQLIVIYDESFFMYYLKLIDTKGGEMYIPKHYIWNDYFRII